MKPTKWLRRVKVEKGALPKSGCEENEGRFYFTAGYPFHSPISRWDQKPTGEDWFWEDGSAIYSRSFTTAKERDAGIKKFRAALNEFCDRIDEI